MNKKMFMEERRNQILNSINNSGRVDVLEIASEFNVSTATIRSDLNYLTNIGKINRTHGGAITKKLTSIVEEEIPVIEKENICIEEKIKIAKAALELIEDKQNIFLDTSSTVYQLAKLLHSKRELKMITNSVRIVQEISCGTDKELILIGGIFRKNSYATSGHLL